MDFAVAEVFVTYKLVIEDVNPAVAEAAYKAPTPCIYKLLPLIVFFPEPDVVSVPRYTSLSASILPEWNVVRLEVTVLKVSLRV